MSFNIGYLVQLKSGGPVMTVTAASSNSATVTCTWFTDGQNHSAQFASDALQAYLDPQKPRNTAYDTFVRLRQGLGQDY